MPKSIAKENSPEKQTKAIQMEVTPHVRTRISTTNSLRDYLKKTEQTPQQYQRQLGQMLLRYPIDHLIETQKWYHLDRTRNRLYHEQYLELWRQRLGEDEYKEVCADPKDFYPVRRAKDRFNYFEGTIQSKITDFKPKKDKKKKHTV